MKEFIVTFLRHGETDANLNKIVSTITDHKLNENGRKQAKALGDALKNEKFTRAYSSDLSRAHDTTIAALANSIHSQPEIIIDKRLRERDGGIWEGKHIQEFRDEVAKSDIPRHILFGKGGETFEDALGRLINFMNEMFNLCDEDVTDENILLGTHGLCIYYYFRYMKAKNGELFELLDFNEDDVEAHPPNTGMTKMKIFKNEGDSKRKIQFLSVHNIDHLKVNNIQINSHN